MFQAFNSRLLRGCKDGENCLGTSVELLDNYRPVDLDATTLDRHLDIVYVKTNHNPS